MCADNAINDTRQADAEVRVLAAVETLRSRGEALGVRAIARHAGASVSTVRKLRHLWQSDVVEPTPETADAADNAQWRARLAVFHPHPAAEYLQSVWPEPVTIDTYARWHAEMTQLRRMYGARTIQLAPTTYRMYADWMNCVLDDACQHLSPQALDDAIARWQGDPVDILLADGAIAGVKLPKAILDTVQAMCQHNTPPTAIDAQHQSVNLERNTLC